jgi:PAS domain S-box-containing protein
MRVLIVEDNAVQAHFARAGLEKRGLEVICATTYEEAANKLLEADVNAILLDLSLPDCNGLETLFKIRSIAADIPIVILTGLDDQDIALDAVKNGAHDYLIKGQAREDSVFRCLRYAIERHKAENALRQSERRLRIILENSYDAFISTDSNWRITEWNRLAEKTFGWARHEVLGQGLALIVPQHLRRQYSREIADHFGGSQDRVARINTEVVAIDKEGREFPIEIGIFRIREEVDYNYCAFVRDITERKHVEQELERRVQLRTTELTRSNEELKQFAKIASHDLQEPLRAIQGFASLLAESARGRLDKDCDDFIDYILDGTERMQELIQSVLLHSSVTSEETGEVTTDCNSVVEEVLVNLSAAITESGAQLQVDNLPVVAVERWQLIQLFQNLISNAIKYRSPETEPQIFISAEISASEWLFSVRDNGIGIKSDYLDKIFDMFARLHAKEEYSGTGMGLAICKKIVTLHGGKIWVESKEGEGSIFLFTLPAVSRLQRRNKMEKEGIQILLVEDSPSDIRLTQEALKRSELNWTMSVVHDGVEAMRFLNEAKYSEQKPLPDIILLDLNMPRKNGHEVLAEIKDDPLLKKIPVVLLTVSQRDEDVMEALKLKMNYYLAKPVTSQKLSVLVKAITELQKDPSGGSDQPHSDEETQVRLVLAVNPHTSVSVLEKLAKDGNPRVRSRVAENPQTPSPVLAQLSSDEDPDVRLSVAENPRVSEPILEALAKDHSEDVRLGIASNPNIPARILRLLLADENTFVSASAKNTLSQLSHSSRAS